MRELNEQELDQVAGGSGGGLSINFNHGTQATASGGASADSGVAFSSSVTGSKLDHHGSSSFAANKSFAAGCNIVVISSASSTSGKTLSIG